MTENTSEPFVRKVIRSKGRVVVAPLEQPSAWYTPRAIADLSTLRPGRWVLDTPTIDEMTTDELVDRYRPRATQNIVIEVKKNGEIHRLPGLEDGITTSVKFLRDLFPAFRKVSPEQQADVKIIKEESASTVHVYGGHAWVGAPQPRWDYSRFAEWDDFEITSIPKGHRKPVRDFDTRAVRHMEMLDY